MWVANGLWAALALILLPGGSRALREGDCEGERGAGGCPCLGRGAAPGLARESPWPRGAAFHRRLGGLGAAGRCAGLGGVGLLVGEGSLSCLGSPGLEGVS